MTRVLLLVALTVVALAAPTPGRGQTSSPVRVGPVPRAAAPTTFQVVDSLASAGALEEAFQYLDARLDVEPGDAEALTQATQVALGLGIMGTSAPVRLRWLRISDGMGRRLLEVRPDDVDALAWAAAARGQLATAEDSPRTVARLGEEVGRLTERVLTLNPDHALGNDVRGKLHQRVMRLSGWRRFLARVFLGSDMASQASWESAEAHLQKAVAGDPGMILFHMDLGDTYRYQGKNAEALEVYRQALALPSLLPIDEHLKRFLRRRIRRMEEGAG